MVYKWKTPGFFKIDADVAGKEFERISAEGALTPEAVVNQSRDKSAVLHPCFDWCDRTAAESYRRVQARELIRNIVTVNVNGATVPNPVRAFVSIENAYKPIGVVVKTKSYKNEMLTKALSELRSFKQKYYNLSELDSVFASIEELTKSAPRVAAYYLNSAKVDSGI